MPVEATDFFSSVARNMVTPLDPFITLCHLLLPFVNL